MPVLDFSSERRPVTIGGRRFFIRRLSVGAVVRGLALFSSEVQRFRDMHEEAPDLWATLGTAPAIEILGLRPDALLAVVREAVESEVPEEEWPLRDLATAIAGLTDWTRVAEGLSFAAGTENVEEERAAENRAFVSVAKEMGVDPTKILDWPFEAWLAAIDTLGPPANASPSAFFENTPGAIRVEPLPEGA